MGETTEQKETVRDFKTSRPKGIQDGKSQQWCCRSLWLVNQRIRVRFSCPVLREARGETPRVYLPNSFDGLLFLHKSQKSRDLSQ
jgi:hypothetical protein